MRAPWEWRRGLLTLPSTLHPDPDEPPCVIHLVRAANGIESLHEFAVALRAHPPGAPHELVIALKGFASRAEAAPYIAEVADLTPTIELFPDTGLDLGLLFAAAERLRRNRYCFINSHTRPAVGGWLAKLDAALAAPEVGIVGATGSWLSSHSWLAYSMGLPSFYRGVLPPIARARRLLLEIDLEQLRIQRRSRAHAARTRLRLLSQMPEELLAFPPFPNPHLRNTMLMFSHELLRGLRLSTVRNKQSTYAMESGPLNLVRQVTALGLGALVVDSAGVAYPPAEWYRSGTYWQGEQERLLAVDNRTRSYQVGSPERRRLLAALSWGLHADSGACG